MRVASVAHLLAMKVLAGRMQDLADFSSLFHHASESDLLETRSALALIEERPSHRQKNLLLEFERLCTIARGEA